MEYFDLIRERRSVRKYTSEPVAEEDLRKIVGAALLSPSACNAQPWRLTVVQDAEKRALLAKAAGIRPPVNAFAPECPVIIVISCDKEPVLRSAATGEPVQNRYAMNDLGSVIAYLTLAAADLGLGTCIMGLFDKEEAAKIVSLPEKEAAVLLVGLGHPADGGPKPKVRLPESETVRYI